MVNKKFILFLTMLLILSCALISCSNTNQDKSKEAYWFSRW